MRGYWDLILKKMNWSEREENKSRLTELSFNCCRVTFWNVFRDKGNITHEVVSSQFLILKQNKVF